MPIPHPKPQDDVRRRYNEARYAMYKIVQTVIGPFTEWPSWILRIFVKDHKTFDDRFALFKFLFANGAAPEEAARWILFNPYAPLGYDASAHNHMRYLVNKAKNNPDYFMRFRIYDMSEKRPTY